MNNKIITRNSSFRLSGSIIAMPLRALCILLLCLGIAACSSAPTRAPQKQVDIKDYFGDRQPVAFVLPVVSPYEMFSSASEPILAAFAEQLHQAGWAGASMPRDNFAQLWASAQADVNIAEESAGEITDEQKRTMVVRRIIEDVSSAKEFDVLLLPVLIMREARANGPTAYWDGVRRNVSAADGASAIGSSEVPALSVVVAAYNSAGEFVYEKHGGLLLMGELRSLRQSADLAPGDLKSWFVDKVKEGVGVSLSPLSDPDVIAAIQAAKKRALIFALEDNNSQ